MKKQIRLYNHDLEVAVVNEKSFINEKYKATVNYANYPYPFAIEHGYTEDEAIDNAAKKLIALISLEGAKNIN